MHGNGCRGLRRAGFTLLELMFAVVIVGVMATVAGPRFDGAVDGQAVRGARTAFRLTASRARAAALERGEIVLLVARPARDTVWVVSASGDTLEVADLTGGRGVDLKMASGSLTVCYSPRGFAYPSCGDGDVLPVVVEFQRGGTMVGAELGVTGIVTVE